MGFGLPGTEPLLSDDAERPTGPLVPIGSASRPGRGDTPCSNTDSAGRGWAGAWPGVSMSVVPGRVRLAAAVALACVAASPAVAAEPEATTSLPAILERARARQLEVLATVKTFTHRQPCWSALAARAASPWSRRSRSPR